MAHQLHPEIEAFYGQPMLTMSLPIIYAGLSGVVYWYAPFDPNQPRDKIAKTYYDQAAEYYWNGQTYNEEQMLRIVKQKSLL